MRFGWPPLVEISTPFGEHHPKVALLGWAAIGLPHPEGWMSRGRITPRDAHGTDLPLVAAIDGVVTAALTPIAAMARKIRRKMITSHYGIPSSSTSTEGSSYFHA
jgi:hypothetical protein